MAISFNSQPQIQQPVFNPFYFDVSSNNTSQPNFKYVFDIYTAITSNTWVARLELEPRPGGTANCIFSPARVLESYLSYDLVQSITAVTVNSNHDLQYLIQFGEEYGLSSTGVTIYSGLTSSTGYTFNGVLSYAQLPNWKSTDYFLTGSTSLYLTNRANPGLFKLSTDRDTISFMTTVPVSNRWIRIDLQNTSGLKTIYIRNDAWSATSVTDRVIQHIPAGPWNLNNIPNSFISGGTQPVVDFTKIISYGVTAVDSTLRAISETFTYDLDTICNRYQPVRLTWVNKLGGWDYFNFTLVSRKTKNTNRGTFKKTLPYNYTVDVRGDTVIDTDSVESSMVTSNWVSQSESDWLYDELGDAGEVYEQLTDGSLIPIIITTSDLEDLKKINDRLINYTFEYKYAFKVNRQRA